MLKIKRSIINTSYFPTIIIWRSLIIISSIIALILIPSPIPKILILHILFPLSIFVPLTIVYKFRFLSYRMWHIQRYLLSYERRWPISLPLPIILIIILSHLHLLPCQLTKMLIVKLPLHSLTHHISMGCLPLQHSSMILQHPHAITIHRWKRRPTHLILIFFTLEICCQRRRQTLLHTFLNLLNLNITHLPSSWLMTRIHLLT